MNEGLDLGYYASGMDGALQVDQSGVNPAWLLFASRIQTEWERTGSDASGPSFKRQRRCNTEDVD